MEDAGEKLRRARERLHLTIRDVEEASRKIATRHNNDEYIVGLSRLSEIENKGSVPTVFRLYSLCVIYRMDLLELLEWFGVDAGEVAADTTLSSAERTHVLGFRDNGRGSVLVPLSLDPGIDFRRNTFLSRLIQRWGKLPLSLLNGTDIKNHRYAFIGTEYWMMHPILPPGSLVMIDETRRKIVNGCWNSEYERPIYFLEHRGGYICGWCTLNGDQLIVQPHPSSPCFPEVYKYEEDIDVLGQITGVAMRLDHGKRRRGKQ